MTKRQILKFFFGLILIILAGYFPATVKAATFYLDPPQQTIGPNDVIEVKVKIGVGGNECINTAQVGITFPTDTLELRDFNSGESFLSFWVDKPDKSSLAKINSSGKIIFSGGIPGGYCGVIPGDPGDSNILGTLIFTPKKPIVLKQAEINFSSETEAFLNDGNGTKAPINTQGSVLSIDESLATKTDVWAELIAEDKTPPEPFTIEINNSQRIAGGKYFLAFSTVDKQTGVDHYEVLESKNGYVSDEKQNIFQRFLNWIFGIKSPPPSWIKAGSPYVLTDQSLNSVIEVKAIDRAGNERIVGLDNATVQTLKKSRPAVDWRSLAYLGGGLLVIIFVLLPVIVILKRRRR